MSVRWLQVHQSSDLLRSNMSLCRSCNRYMSSSRFRPSASDVAIGRCLDCTDRDNAARHRDDFSRFKIILRRLQADELRLSGDAQIPFLLQVGAQGGGGVRVSRVGLGSVGWD